ncbi:MAG: phosphoglucosamine mutase [Armatimonadetes bacterium]|nr:phosphoglucosamine mutase [Armatimonadota bacterium]
MSRKHFGTDGIRGVANVSLTPELAFKLGQASGRFLVGSGMTPKVVLGRDTRRSGPMLSASLAAGFCSVGVDVDDIGVAPTPAVSYVARTFDFGLGAVISASHNPAPDNGIKLLGHDGRKLTDAQELAIEGLMEGPADARPSGAGIGELSQDASPLASYEAYLIGLLPERLDGMKIAIDAAHGAACAIAPHVFRSLGAEVLLTGAEPNGLNINAGGGATKPNTICDFTVASRADIGIAFDGDADRAIFSDEKGTLINGDRTMAIWCEHWKRNGELSPAIAVGTVMSNGGFEHFLSGLGIKLERTPVGDKYVAERLRATGARVGGEQSGHLIFPEFGPTGDGLISAIELLRVLRREGRSASSFCAEYDPWPQVLINVSIRSREGWDQGPRVSMALSDGAAALEGNGRLVVRPSGTQPMIRLMVEAEDVSLRDAVAQSILSAMKEELGGEVYSEVDLTYALGD